MLEVSVVVLAQGPDNKPVSEVTHTVTVNAHGAKVLMRVRVSIGQLLTLKHSGTEEQVLCRVAYISPHQSEKREVGLDFMKACPGFWHIAFPPPDWTTRTSEAKSRVGPSSTKKDSTIKK